MARRIHKEGGTTARQTERREAVAARMKKKPKRKGWRGDTYATGSSLFSEAATSEALCSGLALPNLCCLSKSAIPAEGGGRGGARRPAASPPEAPIRRSTDAVHTLKIRGGAYTKRSSRRAALSPLFIVVVEPFIFCAHKNFLLCCVASGGARPDGGVSLSIACWWMHLSLDDWPVDNPQEEA